jgi:probable addiction module antidote protein
MRKVKFHKWDVADYLQTEEDRAAFLEVSLIEAEEKNDYSIFTRALGDVARAKGMTEVAREAGLGRESLYKSLSENGNPSFATVRKVVGAFGLKPTFVPVN